MAINIRTKGQSGEREVADALNYRAQLAFESLGQKFSWSDDGAQRNQLQTAVGGCDLTNTWGLAIEIKRQEQLSINTWWAQCVKSAERANQKPVLIYRQNRQPWTVVMNAWIMLPESENGDAPWMMARVEMTWDAFLAYYQELVTRMLAKKLKDQIMDLPAAG